MSDRTLTLDDLARAVGPGAAEAALATLGPHLPTLVGQARATIRPGWARSGGGRQRLLDEQPALVFEDELGRGGMGVVRLATQTTTGRKVAVKSLRAGIEAESAVVALLHEAWITGRVEHPHIVPLYDLVLDEAGQPLVVLRRIEGTSWRRLLDDPEAVRARFGVADVEEWHLRTLMEICTAVHFAHQRGILHRDIKPDNVMVGGPGETYLVDWGIARAFAPDSDDRLPHLEGDEGMAGTPAYMAPEMLRTPGSVLGTHTDVYLLGATLYHILAGRPPHEGDTALSIMLNVLKGPPPPPGPTELVEVCRRAMALEPADRYPDVEALRQAIQHHLEHRAAGRLADDAARRLQALEAGMQGMQPDERQRLFGECRFGFTQALASWPACEPARVGRARAVTLMIEQALAEGHADAAAALLAELDAAPAELQQQVAQAQATDEARRARLVRLEEMQREFDPRVGTRARIVLIGSIIALLMLRPTAWLLNAPTEGGRTWLWPTLLIGIAGSALVLARRSLWSTALNRRISAMLLASLVAYGGLSFGMAHLALPYAERSQFGLHFGASILCIFAIAVDLRALVAATTYFLGYLASVVGWINPHLAVLISHTVLGVCVVWIGRTPAPRGFLQVDR